MNIFKIRDDILNNKTTAEDEVKKALSLAKEKQEYNALISLTEERALEKAKEIDQRLKNGEEVGELAGVPFVMYYQILSKVVDNFIIPHTAFCFYTKIIFCLISVPFPFPVPAVCLPVKCCQCSA